MIVRQSSGNGSWHLLTFRARYWYFLAAALIALGCASLPAAAQETAIREDFSSLEAWEAFAFAKKARKTRYEIVQGQADGLLKATSNSSASALIHTKRFNVFQFPILNWRWKVDSVYDGGDATRKEGDDYPLRVYVLFAYDPEKAGLAQKLKYALAKTVHGEYPPDSTLNYIWANQDHEAGVLTNPYTDRAKMIPLQSGESRVGTWQEETRNVPADYRRAFGHDPPETASLAVMNDSDDTGEKSVSYLDWIEISADSK